MGRKIPGKKHRGVKDPLEQLARRNEGLNFDAPPEDPDEQEIPKSVLEIKRLQEMVKEGKFSRKRHKKNKLLNTNKLIGREPKLPGMAKNEKTFPTISQYPGESDESFLFRVNEATNDIVQEAMIEQDLHVHSKRNETKSVEDLTNNYSSSENRKGLLQKKKKLNRKQATPCEEKTKRHLNRRERRKLKKNAKNEERMKDLPVHLDNVQFGEVTHRPPVFSSKPKGAHEKSRFKANVSNLLLRPMFSDSSGKKVLKLPVSVATKRRLEAERESIVEAYRALKKKKKLFQN